MGLVERRKLVNVLDRVATVGHAEAEVKVEALEKSFVEVVSLDHAKVLNGFVANRELDPETNRKREFVIDCVRREC